MDTKALRQKILDLAIRGKLVPQDPNDEPASVLLERIRAEKQQMVKDGKLKPKDIKNDTVIFKGDDNLHYEKFSDGTVKCIEDEIPFDVPEVWAWSRLTAICSLISDIDHKMPKAVDDGVLFLSAKDLLNDGTINYTNDVKMISEEDFLRLSRKSLPQKNDIIYSRIGACLGKARVVTKEIRFLVSYSCCTIRPLIIDSIFLASILDGNFVLDQAKKGTQSVGVPDLGMASIKQFLIPIPPLVEQQRIDERLQSALHIAQQISNEYDNLNLAIMQAKSKILDLAIRGKLVPQDPNDEPASVLLERIRAEKEELIKQGKIKRNKKESVIFKGSDNSYYQDLPSNWIKIRLSTISEIITKGTTPRGGKVAYSQSGIGFLRAENIAGYDKLDLSNLNYIDEKSHNNYLKRSILKENDILITIAGTLGRTAIVTQQALPLNTNQAVAIVRLVNNRLINVKYLVYALNSPIIKSDLLAKSVDMAIPNLSLENIADCNISLPPLSEQKRIVDEIEKIFAILDDIANQVA